MKIYFLSSNFSFIRPRNGANIIFLSSLNKPKASVSVIINKYWTKMYVIQFRIYWISYLVNIIVRYERWWPGESDINYTTRVSGSSRGDYMHRSEWQRWHDLCCHIKALYNNTILKPYSIMFLFGDVLY